MGIYQKELNGVSRLDVSSSIYPIVAENFIDDPWKQNLLTDVGCTILRFDNNVFQVDAYFKAMKDVDIYNNPQVAIVDFDVRFPSTFAIEDLDITNNLDSFPDSSTVIMFKDGAFWEYEQDGLSCIIDQSSIVKDTDTGEIIVTYALIYKGNDLQDQSTYRITGYIKPTRFI